MGGRPPSQFPQVPSGGVQSREPQPFWSRAGGGTMACAGLLTVCLIRPPVHLSPAPAPGPAGHALFQDVSVEQVGGISSPAVGSALGVSLPLRLTVPITVSLTVSVSLSPQVCLGPRLCLSLTLLYVSVSLPLSCCLCVSVCLSFSLLGSSSLSLSLCSPPTSKPTPSMSGVGAPTLDQQLLYLLAAPSGANPGKGPGRIRPSAEPRVP